MTETPVVVQKAYEFTLWMIQKAAGFPKSYRFSIGGRLTDGVLAVLLRRVAAGHRRERAISSSGLLSRSERANVRTEHASARRSAGSLLRTWTGVGCLEGSPRAHRRR